MEAIIITLVGFFCVTTAIGPRCNTVQIQEVYYDMKKCESDKEDMQIAILEQFSPRVLEVHCLSYKLGERT